MGVWKLPTLIVFRSAKNCRPTADLITRMVGKFLPTYIFPNSEGWHNLLGNIQFLKLISRFCKVHFSSLVIPQWDLIHGCLIDTSRTKQSHAIFNPFLANVLFYIWSMFPFYTPWKYQKTFGLMVFSGRLKWEHWPEMG